MHQITVMAVHLEFRGGLELLFSNQKSLTVEYQADWTLKQLIFHIKDFLMTGRPEMFLSGSSLRPGILVLVNDTDWELCDKEDYIVQAADKITFISTLHGG
jgi:ubiquitin related modifier 1